jgi:hypothetical protein
MLSYKAIARSVPRRERERQTPTQSVRELWGEDGDSDEMGVAGGFVCSEFRESESLFGESGAPHKGHWIHDNNTAVGKPLSKYSWGLRSAL